MTALAFLGMGLVGLAVLAGMYKLLEVLVKLGVGDYE